MALACLCHAEHITDAMQTFSFDIYLPHNVYCWKSMSSPLLITVASSISVENNKKNNSVGSFCRRSEPHATHMCVGLAANLSLVWFGLLTSFEWLNADWTCSQCTLYTRCAWKGYQLQTFTPEESPTRTFFLAQCFHMVLEWFNSILTFIFMVRSQSKLCIIMTIWRI